MGEKGSVVRVHAAGEVASGPPSITDPWGNFGAATASIH